MKAQQAKIIPMTGSPAIKGSCGSGGCSIQPYILPFIELRPWDGNRRETVRKAA